jgi:hypothetical protein
MVLLVAARNTFAPRYSKIDPPNGVPSWQPSTGWQPSPRRWPPHRMRSSSSTPSSNSWLPTPLTSRPIEFIASIAGSSWNSAGAHGDAQGTITDSAGKTQVTTLSVKVAAG